MRMATMLWLQLVKYYGMVTAKMVKGGFTHQSQVVSSATAAVK